MYITVGPGGGTPPKFTLTSLAAARSSSGDALVVSEIHNTGANTLDLTGVLMLTHGPGGLGAGPFRATMGSCCHPDRASQLRCAFHRFSPRTLACVVAR